MDLRVEIPVHIKRDRRARKVVAEGQAPTVEESVPRMARLLPLAHKWEGMVRRGEVKDYAEIARRYRISRARGTQVCSLTSLPPRTQETILLASDGIRSVPRLRFAHPLRNDQNPTR